MPSSVTSVFSEAKDFAVAMREEGCLALLVTGSGQFRARLTQVALLGLRLSATDEQLPRIALVAVPADTILVSLPRGKGPAPIWGGITIGAGEIMTLGAGQRLHMRTDGPCRWGSIWLPAADLAQYGSRFDRSAVLCPLRRSSVAPAAGDDQASAAPPFGRHRLGRAAVESGDRCRSGAWAGAAIDPYAGRVPLESLGDRGCTRHV